MEGATVAMALVDFIPVLCFATIMGILQCDLFNKFNRKEFALFSLGSVLCSLGGCCKATWKLILALKDEDKKILNKLFIPLQLLGFTSLITSIVKRFKRKKENSGKYGIFAVIKTLIKLPAIAFFCVSFASMSLMGILASKFDNSPKMHWIAQITNTIGQGSMLAGVISLHNSGLKSNGFFKDKYK